MSGDIERVGAFLALFAVADVPLVGVAFLPPGASAVAVGLVGVSWVGTGLAVAAAASMEVEPRGSWDLLWVAVTVMPPVLLMVLSALGLLSGPGLLVGSVGATSLLAAFWLLYAQHEETEETTGLPF